MYKRVFFKPSNLILGFFGWIRTGQGKVLETTGSRSRLNIIGALSLLNIADTIIRKYDIINSESIVYFFRKSRGCYRLGHKLQSSWIERDITAAT